MVQRKALVKQEKSFYTSSHHLHQETRNKGGSGEVKKKKKKMEFQFDDKSLPNYMKPTTCSGARKVTPVDPPTKTSCSGSKPAKSLVRKSSLKHVKVGPSVVCNPRKLTVKRATCSSTQKDSKFPKALDLNPEGTSVIKVCPYNYCSLNGHRHEALPPLKSFLESRRLSLKIEQRMKLKRKEFDARKKVKSKNQPLVEELGDDFFVEIYAEELVSCDQSVVVDEINECQQVVLDDNGSDCSSELSMSLLEYVEFDQAVKDVMEIELKCAAASEQRGIEDAADGVCENVYEKGEFEKLVGESSEDHGNELIVEEGEEEEEEEEEEEVAKSNVEDLAGESAEISITCEELSETDKSTTTDSDRECLEASDEDEELDQISRNRARARNRSHTAYNDNPNPKLRMRITRKERTEEEEIITREFNPRSPSFLPIKPDPDNEKVDLKHQEMDDRKNAEEWMVDYALRQAVRKLSPASRRKVALLVKAFETVIPVRIQACR